MLFDLITDGKRSDILLYFLRISYAYFLKSAYKDVFRALFIRRKKNNQKKDLTWKKKYTTRINTNICSGYIDKHIQNPLKPARRKKK